MNGIAYTTREEWLELRRGGIGGSDAAAIIGVSRWASPNDVWEDKLGIAPVRPVSAPMEWGNRLEAVVADAVADRTGLRLRKSHRILVHPTAPFPMFASVDRLAGDAVVEIKTARSDDGWVTEEEAPDVEPEHRVPAQYYVQGQHYAAVTGKPRVIFGVLIGGSELRVIETPADPAFAADLMAEEHAFWSGYVETAIRPPLTGLDQGLVARLYPHGSGEKVATPEIDAIVEELVRLRDQQDDLTRARDAMEVRIKSYLGDASDLVSSAARVTWRESERKRVAWEEIAGGLRSAIGRLIDPEDPLGRYTRNAALAVLSDGFGTTDPDEITALFTSTSTLRTFRIDRKKGAKA